MDRLRDRMARELRVRGMADRTVESYVDDVRLLVERTGLHPARLSEENLKAYLDDLRRVRQVAPSTFAQHVAAMRFFFAHVVHREFPILIQQFLGHRNIETTTIYTHMTDGSMGRVHEALGLMTAAL